MVVCPNCQSHNLAENGLLSKDNLYLCKDCGLNFASEEKNFASRILEIRKTLDLTREELGNYLNVSSHIVGFWESGKVKKARYCTMRLIDTIERQIAANEVVPIYKRKHRRGPRFKN